jgi:type IV pilus assembly protein PilC
MPEFKFQGRTDEGRPVVGLVTASTLARAGRLLNNKHLFVAGITPVEDKTSTADVAPHARPAEVAWQLWQLSIMIDTGIGLADAVACLARQSSRPPARALLKQVAAHICDGCSLSEAMARFPDSFPSSLVALIRASELSGTLGEILKRASHYLASDIEVCRKIRGAALYPVLMLALCAGVATFLLTFVMPKFAGIFSAHDAVLPLPTRVLMSASEGLVAHWPVWFGGAVTLALIVCVWVSSAGGRRQIDFLLINLPVVSGIVNPLIQSRCFRTMAVLLDAHVSLEASVAVVRDITPNTHYRDLWNEVEEQIHVGECFALPFLTRRFVPESLGQVIANGDQTGNLAKSFTRLAEFTEAEYNRAITSTTKLVEPIMIFVIGSVIAFVAVSLLLPLFQAGHVLSH